MTQYVWTVQRPEHTELQGKDWRLQGPLLPLKSKQNVNHFLLNYTFSTCGQY